MKLRIPTDWARGLPADEVGDVVSGRPASAPEILTALKERDVVVPALLQYFQEMVRAGWIRVSESMRETDPRVLVGGLLQAFPQERLARLRGAVQFNVSSADFDARVPAWLSHLNQISSELTAPPVPETNHINESLLSEIAKLSVDRDGPLRALQRLHQVGIVVLLEPPLAGTRVDGAAFWSWACRPAIGLSLRHDRLDNFWFTLLHELAHVVLHFDESHTPFADDLDTANTTDEVEIEADRAVKSATVPQSVWKRSLAFKQPSDANIKALAKERGIHPAIIAGRIRYERRDYRLFANLVGQGEISRLFPDVRPPKR